VRPFAIFGLFLVSWSSALRAQSSAGPPERPLVITHVTVIDATGGPPLNDRTVVLSNHRISSVAGAPPATFPEPVHVIDASGKFLIPGLWDMHAHFSERDYLPLYLVNGVTGLRIMWGDSTHHEMRNQIEARTLVGPRMVIASSIIDGPSPFGPAPFPSIRPTRREKQLTRRNRRALISLRSIRSSRVISISLS
jgi:hypothetical protein